MRAIHWKVVIVALFLTVACGEKRPADVLSKGEMVEILEEVYVAEARLNQLALPRDSAKLLASVMSHRIYSAAGVTDSAFQRSLDYYMARPAELEEIYTALVDTLQLREQRAKQP